MLDCDNPFRKFSLAVYAAPGVAAGCLALQDALNIDVNSLLFVAWLGASKKIVLSETELTAIEAHVREWHATVVRPLRALRRHVKTLSEMREDAAKLLSQDIAAVELRAKQIEQAFLFESARGMAAGAATATGCGTRQCRRFVAAQKIGRACRSVRCGFRGTADRRRNRLPKRIVLKNKRQFASCEPLARVVIWSRIAPFKLCDKVSLPLACVQGT